MRRVAIGVPMYGNGKERFWGCLAALREYSHSRGIKTELFKVRGCYVEHGRNVLVSLAKAHRFDFLLFADDDMTFPRDALVRLLSHKKDVVVGNYFRKQSPHVPVVSVLDDGGRLTPVHVPPEGAGVLPVSCGGTGLCLINMRVFLRMPFPWFFNEYSLPMDGEQPEGMVEGHVLIGEDTRFFMLAHRYDFDVWCDFSIEAGHIGEKEYTFQDFEQEHAKLIGGSGPDQNHGGTDSGRAGWGDRLRLWLKGAAR